MIITKEVPKETEAGRAAHLGFDPGALNYGGRARSLQAVESPRSLEVRSEIREMIADSLKVYHVSKGSV